jgi:hypothetical protein
MKSGATPQKFRGEVSRTFGDFEVNCYEFDFSEDSLFGCSLPADGRKRAGSVLSYGWRFWQHARVCRVKFIGNLFLRSRFIVCFFDTTLATE